MNVIAQLVQAVNGGAVCPANFRDKVSRRACYLSVLVHEGHTHGVEKTSWMS